MAKRQERGSFYRTNMPLNLRYSAAKSSRISKNSLNSSPIKKAYKLLKEYLPSQKKYFDNLKKKSSRHVAQNEDEPTDKNIPAHDYNVHLPFELSAEHNLEVAVDTIVDNLWSENTKFHSRYLEDNLENSLQKERLFLLLGLSLKSKADIIKYRMYKMPQGLTTLNQLYSIYRHHGPTFVDRMLELRLRQGKLKKFVITNAAPVILHSNNKYQSGKISYGYENVEVIVRSEKYLSLIKEKIKAMEGESKTNSTRVASSKKLKKFYDFIIQNPASLFINSSKYFSDEELSELVNYGFLTLTSNHLNEIESHQYSIAYPNCGTFLKVINSGRAWIVKTLNKCSNKEILEEQLFNKWEGTTFGFNGQSKRNNFRSPFYGYDLYWILADALGAGVVEVFNTPVGRGWCLTGKV